MIIFLLLLPFIIGIPLGIVVWIMDPKSASEACGLLAAARRGRGRGRRSRGFFGSLIKGQSRTERRNSSHRGVMCGPGGRGPRGGRRR